MRSPGAYIRWGVTGVSDKEQGVSVWIAFFKKIVLIGGQLLHNIVMDSAIHRHDSATGAHFLLLHCFEDSQGLALVTQ